MKQSRTDRLLTLGMALTADKRTMERRVRGVFSRKRSARAALALSLALVLALAAGGFTTACQPEKSAGDAASQPEEGESPLSEQGESPLYERLGVPKHWAYSGASSDGKVSIDADIDIDLPNVEKVPVAQVQMRRFNETDLKNVARVLFGPDAQFTLPESMTREGFQRALEGAKESLAYYEGQDEQDPDVIALTKRYIQNCEILLERAPAEDGERKIPLALSDQIDITSEIVPGFTGIMELDGYKFQYTLMNEMAYAAYEKGEASYIYASMGESGYSGFYGTVKEAPEGVLLTKEQAALQAKAIAAQLTDDLELCLVAPVHGNKAYGRKEGWACVFARTVNGVPAAYDSKDVNSDLYYDVPFAQLNEQMTIVMDDFGVADFQWVDPMAVTQIEQEDAALLSFDQVLAKMPDALRAKLGQSGESWQKYAVTVQFGLMRIGAGGSGSYTLEPVWDFFFSSDQEQEAVQDIEQRNALLGVYPQAWDALTLSALDGRVIDRNWGY